MAVSLDPSFTDLLSEYLAQKHWTPVRLAEALGKPRSTVSRWLSGERRPRPETLQRLAVVLRLNAAQRQHLTLACGNYRWRRDVVHSAPSSELPPYSVMPLQRNANFQGRCAEIKTLSEALARPRAVVAIAGIGGLGKTQLACEVVYHAGGAFPGGVFWLNCTNAETLQAELAACGGGGALDLRPDFESLPQAQRLRLVETAWREPVPRLLVFDSCEDPALLRRYRPVSGGCRVLITSHRTVWDDALAVEVLALEPFARAESLAMLAGAHEHDPAAFDALAALLGDLPLAIHLASRHLRRHCYRLTPADYLAELQHGAAKTQIVGHQSLRGDDDLPSLHYTLRLSYERIGQTNPVEQLARALFICSAMLESNTPIPRMLLHRLAQTLAEAATPTLIEEALLYLSETPGLLSVDRDGALRIHPLVAAMARQQANGVIFHPALLRTLTALLAALNASETLMSSGLLVHVCAVALNLAARADALLLAFLHALSEQLWRHEHAAALPCAERALALSLQLHGPEHLMSAACASRVAMALHIFGELERARALLEQAISLRMRLQAPDHHTLVRDRAALGYVHLLQGDYQIAQALFVQTLHVRRRTFGLWHHETARALHNLGFVLLQRGRLASARRLLATAYKLRDLLLPRPHQETALSAMLLGMAELRLNRTLVASARLEFVHATFVQLFGAESIPVAEALRHLALVRAAQGRLPEAHASSAEALALMERLIPPKRLDWPATQEIHGSILRLQGEPAAARAYLEQALTRWRESFGADHLATTFSLMELGLLEAAEGQTARAAALLRHALGIRERAYGRRHPETIQVRLALAQLGVVG